MNIFDIIGPVMIGPSSSHTAGAVRIGRVARALLEEEPAEATLLLHGSFAHTYIGHGTDKALIAGLLGMLPDDMRIRNSLEIAHSAGLNYKFETVELRDCHPNTALLRIKSASGRNISVQASSVGGGSIMINQINGIRVEFTGSYETIIVSHKDEPGTIALVTNILGSHRINIANMKVYRSSRGGTAFMIIETDQKISGEIKASIENILHISGVTVIEPV